MSPDLHPVAGAIAAVAGLVAGVIEWEEWPLKLGVFLLGVALAFAVQLWA